MHILYISATCTCLYLTAGFEIGVVLPIDKRVWFVVDECNAMTTQA